MRSKELTGFAKRLRKHSTPQEKILWSRLRARRLIGLKFKRQYPIGNYIADFVCIERGFIIELDGRQHGFKDEHEYDLQRDAVLNNLGYRISRITNREINTNLNGVLLAITSAVDKPD